MTADVSLRAHGRDLSISLGGLRFAIFTTRNFVYLIAVIAMNYTLMRPSPVDLLFILSFLMTMAHIAVSERKVVTRRAVFLALLVGAWAVSFTVASLPHIAEKNVTFELLAKTFAISIGIIGAFVSMSWNKRHFERFMRVYVLSTVIASTLGTIGFLTQMDLLTWDGRARGLIDDPNMYGSFLIPGVMFSLYFIFRPNGGRLLMTIALSIIMLGILLSFSRIALVITLACATGSVIYHNRKQPVRLIVVFGSLVLIGLLLAALASLASPEFIAKFADRLTLAKSYDLGEEGRYHRYVLVLPMIMQNPMGLGVLQLEKIFPEPIHDIWLSSFVNYGWVAGFVWIILTVSSVVVSFLNYRKTRSDIAVTLLIAQIGIVACASLHEGEHWRHMWLMFGVIWGFCPLNFETPPPKGRAAIPAASH